MLKKCIALIYLKKINHSKDNNIHSFLILYQNIPNPPRQKRCESRRDEMIIEK
jgi:hypothetical protein